MLLTTISEHLLKGLWTTHIQSSIEWADLVLGTSIIIYSGVSSGMSTIL